MINRHIARQNFILNDPFSGGRNPGEIIKFTSQMFLRPLQYCVLQTQAECKYKFVHIELVHVSMILNGSAHVFLNLNKNNKQSLKFIQVHKKIKWEC